MPELRISTDQYQDEKQVSHYRSITYTEPWRFFVFTTKGSKIYTKCPKKYKGRLRFEIYKRDSTSANLHPVGKEYRIEGEGIEGYQSSTKIFAQMKLTFS